MSSKKEKTFRIRFKFCAIIKTEYRWENGAPDDEQNAIAFSSNLDLYVKIYYVHSAQSCALINAAKENMD